MQRLAGVVVILAIGMAQLACWGQDAKSGRPVRKGKPSAEKALKDAKDALKEAEASEAADKNAEAAKSGEEKDNLYSQLSMLASAVASEKDEDRDVFFYECQHIRSSGLKRVLETFLTPAGSVSESEESDTIVVADTLTNLEILKKIAQTLDKKVPQLLVEARVVEFTIDNQFEKEINLAYQYFKDLDNIAGLPADSMDFVKRLTDAFVQPGSSPNNTGGNLSWSRYSQNHNSMLSVFIKFLETRGKAKILSAPNLILRRGAEGSIITGQEVPIQMQTVTSGSVSTSTEFKSVGIKLRVTPQMITGKKARLKVSPEVSNVTSVDDATGAPIIAVRNANTELEMLDGQMISIGGLLRNEERQVHRRVPILGSIPILGHLFRGTETQKVQSQLVIFLSIRMLDLGELEDATPASQDKAKKERYEKKLKKMEEDLKTREPGLSNDIKTLKELE